jgi:hypothetical protein
MTAVSKAPVTPQRLFCSPAASPKRRQEIEDQVRRADKDVIAAFADACTQAVVGPAI